MRPRIKSAEKDRNASSRIEGVGRKLANVRDVVLIAFAGIYALGYVVRAFYAWWFNLGVLPSIELQYFAAGLALVVLIALPVAFSYLALVWILKLEFVDKLLNEKLANHRFEPARRYLLKNKMLAKVFLVENQEASNFVTVVVLWLGLLFIALLVVTSFLDVINLLSSNYFSGYTLLIFYYSTHPVTLILLAGPFVYLLLVWLVASDGSDLSTKRQFALFLRILFVLVSVFFVIVYLIYFIPTYSRLPQELGGASPRCVRLDIDPALVSREILGRLVRPLRESVENKRTEALKEKYEAAGQRINPNESKVLQTRPLFLFYSDGDRLLVRWHDARDPFSFSTYELRRAAVGAVRTCTVDEYKAIHIE